MIRSPKFLILALLAPLAAVALSMPAEAAGPPRDMQAREQMMQQKLGLSAEQAQHLKEIRESAMQQGKALHERARQKRHELMQYLNSPEATESHAMRLNGELNEVQRQLGELRLKTWFRMRGHLTPEQLRKMKELHSGMHGRRGRQPGS